MTPGNLVSVNDPTGLVTITQVRPIRVAFTLPERDLAALRKAYITKPPAVVRVYAPGASEPLATGELDFVDSIVDSTSGTIAAKAKFANENFELWPGMYVDVEIDLAVRPKTVMIPTVAIQSGQNGPFVFVAKAGPEGRDAQGRAGRRRGRPRRARVGRERRRAGHRRGPDAPGRRRARRRGRQPTAAQRRRRAPAEAPRRRTAEASAMNISEFCIRHPVATTLMSAALVVGGMFAYMFLPVAALPRTEFPVVNVSASLPGASPDTMANSVATPLIKQFSTIAGIDTHQRDQLAGLDLDRASSSSSTATSTAPPPTCSRRSPARSGNCRPR